MPPAHVIVASRRAMRTTALLPWLMAAVAAAALAGFAWAMAPSIIYPASELPECSVTLPEAQVRASEQRT